MKGTTIVIFLLAVFNGYSQNTVSFTEEYIEFLVRDSIFSVNGEYHFQNNTVLPAEQKIFFPIPSRMGEVDSVHIFNQNTGEFVSFDKEKEGIRFRIDISANDFLSLNIFYIQKIISDSVMYILTTTRLWQEPLRNAEYTLTVSGRKVTGFSINPDKEITGDKQTWYYWKRKDFMPDRDFVIYFEVP